METMRHEVYKITQLMDWFKASASALIVLRQSSKGSLVHNMGAPDTQGNMQYAPYTLYLLSLSPMCFSGTSGPLFGPIRPLSHSLVAILLLQCFCHRLVPYYPPLSLYPLGRLDYYITIVFTLSTQKRSSPLFPPLVQGLV
jgi:hypothetical protein